jgi:dTDP-4-dehydrorhamnose reductase
LNYLILMCSVLYGRSFNPLHPNWFEFLQASLVKGVPLAADDSVVLGFLDVTILAKILKAAFNGNITNRLIHVSSRDFMSRYDFAQMYSKVFRRDSNMIQRVTGKFPIDTDNKSGSVASQNYYFKLDTTNAESFLGTKMPSVEESLQYTHKRLTSQR